MADAEPREIRHHLDRIGEAELGVELEAIGRVGHALGPGAAAGGNEAALGHRLRMRRDARVAWPGFERERQLAPPVGMLVDAAGQIGLLEQLQHILGLLERDLARRARDETVRRERRAVEAFALECARELLLVGAPQLALLPRIDAEAQALAQLKVMLRPVAAPCRQ